MNTSGRDETLACGLYTGIIEGAVPCPVIQIASFDYASRPQTLLDRVADAFGDNLARPLSEEHQALLERGEEQLPDDKVVVESMSIVQQEASVR